MKVLLYPFFSQQDKVARRFRLDSDSGVKLYAYMAKRMAECGWKPTFVLPSASMCIGEDALDLRKIPRLRVIDMAIDNLDRRLQWNPNLLRIACSDIDLVLTQHEFLAYPLRCIMPKLKIVMECGIRPKTAWPQTEELFPLAWRAADAIHFNSRTLADEVAHPRKFVWQFAYDDSVEFPVSIRGIDVLFNSRCSATNYTHHREFLAAFADSKLRIYFTDPTQYLKTQKLWPSELLSQGEYRKVLSKSKVVVGLTDNGYGGYAFREAIAAGCTPVALDVPEYRELLGESWPYYCTLHNVREVVERALANSVPLDEVQRRNSSGAYSNAWKQARSDLECLA